MARTRRFQRVSQATSTAVSPATTSSTASGRLNTHVLLALSFLVLSANARPVASSGNELKLGGLLSGDFGSGMNGVTEKIAEGVLKLFHLTGEGTENTQQKPLGDILPEAEQSALVLSPPANSSEDTEITPPPRADTSPDEQLTSVEKTRLVEALLHQNPALSIALGVSDLMRKMRELLVDIAILEGEERGIRTDDNLVADDEASRPQLEEPKAVGQVAPVARPAEEQLFFEIDEFQDSALDNPGQVSQPSQKDLTPSDPQVNPPFPLLVDPSYGAASLSVVLTALCIVGLVVGRAYLSVNREENVEDEMERGLIPEDGQKDEIVGKEKEELNEKTALELHPSPSADGEATQALELLLDVATAAFNSADPEKALSTTVNPPAPVANALEVVRMKMSHLVHTRPSTPVLKFTPAHDNQDEESVTSSSYVSAHEMSRAASPSPAPASVAGLLVASREETLRSASPAPSWVTAQGSEGFSTPIRRSIDINGRKSMEHLRSSFERVGSPVPQIPGSLYDGGQSLTSEMEEVNVLGMMTERANGNGMLPPAYLTQTALDLALMLPATEWIFNFLIVFVGWFGFLMNAPRGRERRRA